ncbi:hypothetical protein J8J14_19275 [Roseomonas sp. SSH11]|uniref:Lipoprotein n=1 Tax=Pararoseomonas baculiformis TaxID=2820812 RepID=A0ABS4AJ68_9PROT|nr:hypothetical protein [Pararoseomonas baculiformis]MBP0446921.1 hypothetical protein [Pararoseomonas baculiformis]
MSGILRGAGFVPVLLLAACAQGGFGQGGYGQGGPGPGVAVAGGTAADRAYACQMRGALAEDRVYGPFGKLDIDSALVRNEVTEACLTGTVQAGTLPTPYKSAWP